MGPKTRLLTHKERILLLIDEVDFDKEDYMAPYILCQDGISEALDILKNNVSREITGLKEESLIKEELSRVKGVERRRNIYLLTEKGEEAAYRIENEILEEEILVEDNGKKKISLKEALDRLKENHQNVTPLHIEEWLRKKDVLHVHNFKTPSFVTDGTEEEKVEMIVSAPSKGDFYGRKEEIKNITSLLKGSVPPIVLISGIAGIGKSSLGIMLMDELKNKKDILWYSFQKWDNKESLGKVISDFCVRGGMNSLDTEKSLPIITTEFIEKISGLDPVIFLDDCENLSDDLEVFFEIALEHKKRGEDFALILMSRKKMNFYDVRDIMDDHVFELELGPLDIEYVKEMIGGEKNAERIYEKTEGHPLYIELSKKYPGETTRMNDFIEDEIYSKLEEREKAALRKLSVFWEPVSKDIILDEGELDILIRLKKNNLVKETRDGKVTIHSILKEFFYEHLSMDKRKELHLKAAERLKRFEGVKKLEILYHFEKAERWKESLELMKELTHQISTLNDSLREEIIKGFPGKAIPENDKGEYYEILGNIYLESEEWKKAKEYYQKAVENGMDSTLMREKLGEAQMKLQQWNETIESHKKALKKYKEKEDKKGVAREYLSLGTVYRKKGEYKKAEKYYENVKNIIENKDYRDIKPTLFNNLGMLALAKKDFKRCEDMLFKSLKVGGEKGVIYENLSLLYKNKGETVRSLEYLEKSIKNYYSKGKQKLAVNLLLDSADRYLETGDAEQAVDNLKKGVDIEQEKQLGFSLFKSTKMSRLEVQLHNKLADVLRNKDWTGCLNHRMRAVKGFADLGEQEKSDRVMLKYAFDLHDSGRSKEAINALDELISKLKEKGVMNGVNACELEKARVYRKMGRYQEAKNILDDIIERSKEMGDEKALKRAKDIRNNVLKKMGKNT